MNASNTAFKESKNVATQNSTIIVTREGNIITVPIKYKKVTINEHNIKTYRSDNSIFWGGEADRTEKSITVYRYIIDKKLNLKPDDYIYKTVSKIRRNEPETIAHELKHLKNIEFGDPAFVVKNYYEICGLYAFDEVSAYAAEYLVGEKSVTHSDICRAVYMGINDLLGYKSIYMPQYKKQIQEILLYKNSGKTLGTTIRHIKQNITEPAQYSKTFYTIVNGYLTFDGQGVRDSKNNIPTELKEKMESLNNVYVAATKKALNAKLKKFTQLTK